MKTDHFKDEMCLLQSPIAMMMILIIFTTMIIIIVMSDGAALPPPSLGQTIKSCSLPLLHRGLY